MNAEKKDTLKLIREKLLALEKSEECARDLDILSKPNITETVAVIGFKELAAIVRQHMHFHNLIMLNLIDVLDDYK